MKFYKFILLSAFLSAFFTASAQDGNIAWLEINANSTFNQGSVPAPKDDWPLSAVSQEYLYNTLPDFKDQRSRLNLSFQNESPVGYHFSFIQIFEGNEIYGTEVKINIAKNYKILSLFEKTISTDSWRSLNIFPDSDSSVILKLLAADAKINELKKVIFINENNMPVPAYRLDYVFANGSKHEELIINTGNKILYRRDLNLYSGKRDTTAMGYIFLPDPLSTAKVNYGSPYIDNKDSAVFELDMERKIGTLKVTVEEDSMYLESQYVKIMDLDNPFTIPTYSKNGTFFYSRSEPGFEDVNAYFHINAYQDYIQKLGFTNLATYQLKVDAHGMTADQSQFSNDNNNLNILFGIGGVDDAEDADVLIHEYCHAISKSASNSAFGFERLILEEGLCDYLACSYSKSLVIKNWERLFNWDGHNPFYEGRWCVTNKVYPKSVTSGSPHKFADLWAGAMMDIHDAIGRAKTDRLMLLSLFSMSSNMRLPDAARLIIQADSLLFEGKEMDLIIGKFDKYGLVPQEYHKTGIDELTGKPTARILSKYFSSDAFLYVKFNQPQNGRMVLYNLQGKELFIENIYNAADLNIYVPGLAKGLYILQISTNGIQESVKLLKQ